MKKTLLFLFCFCLALTAKAANYEIATALSNPYGFYSTFTVFGDAEIKNLQIGVKRAENPDAYLPNNAIIYAPVQESVIDVWDQPLSLRGNIDVSRNLILISAGSQEYNSISIYKISTNDAYDTLWQGPNTGIFDFNCSNGYCVNIGTLNTRHIASDVIEVGTNSDFTLQKVYTYKLKINKNANSFTFPKMRFGNEVGETKPVGVQMFVEQACTSAGVNTYGPWTNCSSSTCANDCIANNTAALTTDPCNSPHTTSTIVKKQKRTITYTEPDAEMRPSVEREVVIYRKCSYKEDSSAEGGFKCVKPDGETSFGISDDGYAEETIANELASGGLKVCGASIPTKCSTVCNLYGGCNGSAKKCVYYEDYAGTVNLKEIGKTMGNTACVKSGWEKGSGLECADSTTRIVYTIYTCPANSDYIKRPISAQTVYQCRKVTCPLSGASTEACSTQAKFLTIK